MTSILRLPIALLLGASLALAGCAGESTESDPTTTTEDPVVAAHTEVVRRRIEANNAKDWSTWQSLHTTGAVRTAPGLPGPITGAAAMRAAIEELVQTFPDYHLELVEAYGSGDRLAARIHTKGTMLGPMTLGDVTIPPTGKSFEQEWVGMLVFEGDQISRIDEFYDNYETLIQLGLAEAP
ncbi:MAG: ester cyclase [Minicystis sp.]